MKKDTPLEQSLIQVNETLEEIKEHGDANYPVGAYTIDLLSMYGGFVRWHWHNEVEISLVQKGKAIFYAEERYYELSEGQGIFINQNILHSIRPCEGTNCIFHTFVFDANFLIDSSHTNLASRYLTPLLDNRAVTHVVFDQTQDFHKDLFHHVRSAFRANIKKEFGYELETRKFLTDFWLTILRHVVKKDVPETNKNPQQSIDKQRAKEAMLFIQENYAKPLTLTEIADSIEVSKGECCRCFKRIVHMSPFEYLMQYRIFMAANIMSSPQPLPMSKLAETVGFNSNSYFNKVFRRYLHCTPTQYRKKQQKEEIDPNNHFGSEISEMNPLKLDFDLSEEKD